MKNYITPAKGAISAIKLIQKTAEVLLLPVLTVFIGCGQKTVIMLW